MQTPQGIIPGPYAYPAHFVCPSLGNTIVVPAQATTRSVELSPDYDFKLLSIQYQPQPTSAISGALTYLYFKFGDQTHDFTNDWINLKTIASQGFNRSMFNPGWVFPRGSAIVMRMRAYINGASYIKFGMFVTVLLDGEYGDFGGAR